LEKRWVRNCWTIGLLLFSVASSFAQTAAYKYIRIGSPDDATVKTVPGYALMGGGSDLDEAFQWLCDKAPGGDFLILRAAGDDDYNDYVNKLCRANSVATLIIPSREAAADPKVSQIINAASRAVNRSLANSLQELVNQLALRRHM